MQERVEVFSNPRVDLTAAQMRKAFAPAKKRRKSSAASNPKKKKKKKKRGKKRQAKVPIIQLLIGSAVAAAVEIYVFRNPDYKDKINPQVRRYSGAIMAVVGLLGATMLKGKLGRQVRPSALGMAAAGAFLQLSDQLVQMRKDAVIDEVKKWSEDIDITEKETGTDGLGRLYGHRYPAAPNMTAAQAAAALGMQSRIPYHPYGLGTFDYSAAPGQRGLGVFVGGPAPMDRSNDPILDPGGLGLGDLVDSGEAGAWLEGQFAFSDSDYRTEGW